MPSTQGLSQQDALAIRSAFSRLLEHSDSLGAAAAARDMLQAGRGGAAAQVLLAQTDFAEGRYQTVIDRLTELDPLSEDVGGTALALVLGRAAENQDDPILAYSAYRNAGPDMEVAARRAADLEPTALQLAQDEVFTALSQSRIEEAEQWLETLAAWAPDAPATIEAELAVATSRNDVEGELLALRRLRARTDLPLEEALRLAGLEVQVGEAQAGVELYTVLSERHPDNPEVEDGLAAAKFRFRLDMLPEEASSLVRDLELSRAEFASLLYWVVPGLRSDRSGSGEILSDILEHPLRTAIVRVVNLGIMDALDSARYRFAPDRAISRGEALGCLLRVPKALGAAPSCLGSFTSNPAPSMTAVCETAQRCGLLGAEEECLAESPLTGGHASESLRHVLQLLE